MAPSQPPLAEERRSPGASVQAPVFPAVSRTNLQVQWMWADVGTSSWCVQNICPWRWSSIQHVDAVIKELRAVCDAHKERPVILWENYTEARSYPNVAAAIWRLQCLGGTGHGKAAASPAAVLSGGWYGVDIQKAMQEPLAPNEHLVVATQTLDASSLQTNVVDLLAECDETKSPSDLAALKAEASRQVSDGAERIANNFTFKRHAVASSSSTPTEVTPADAIQDGNPASPARAGDDDVCVTPSPIKVEEAEAFSAEKLAVAKAGLIAAPTKKRVLQPHPSDASTEAPSDAGDGAGGASTPPWPEQHLQAVSS